MLLLTDIPAGLISTLLKITSPLKPIELLSPAKKEAKITG
jgi:hypothetical protein